MNFSQGRSGAKVQCESCLFSQGKTPEFTKKGEIHELFVLPLSLVWFAGAIPEFLRPINKAENSVTSVAVMFSFGPGSPIFSDILCHLVTSCSTPVHVLFDMTVQRSCGAD